MNEITNIRPIEVITAEIQFYKAQAGTSLLEIGRRLIEAKEQLEHGDWLPWLHDKAEFSERTAQNLMRIAREYTNPQLVADLGVQKSLLMIAMEEAEREEFVSETHTVDGQEKSVSDMTAKELQRVLKELEETRQQAKETEEQLTLKLEALADEREESRAEHEGMIAELKEKLDQAQEQAARKESRVAELEQQLEEVRQEAAEPSEDVLVQIRKEAAAEEAERLQKKLDLARENADKAREAQERAEKRLKEAQEQINAAEEAARAQEAEAMHKQEELQSRLEKAEKQLAASGDQGLAAFRAHFQLAQEEINKLLDCLDKLQADGSLEQAGKMRRAMEAFLSQSLEAIRQG